MNPSRPETHSSQPLPLACSEHCGGGGRGGGEGVEDKLCFLQELPLGLGSQDRLTQMSNSPRGVSGQQGRAANVWYMPEGLRADKERVCGGGPEAARDHTPLNWSFEQTRINLFTLAQPSGGRHMLLLHPQGPGLNASLQWAYLHSGLLRK